MEFIYHISDIHIRLYNRQEEYQAVFQRLYQFLREEKEGGRKGVVVITGDLLHNKNELSPECIVLTRNFIIELGNIFPVILIAGNHDALLNNQHRMDSLSAVLDPMPPNVHYYKYTGWYTFENIVFGVSSLLDGKMLSYHPSVKKDGIDCVVGLYHGGVGKFSTNKGFVMEGIPTSFFDGYSMVLLGDIHLHQYLDKQQRIAYAGSLISQNFTETDANHGVLVWNVKDGSSYLVPLENECAYCEGMLDYPHMVMNGIKYTIEQLPALLPKQGRCNLVLSRTKQAEDIEWIQTLSQEMPGLSIKEKPVLSLNIDIKGSGATTAEKKENELFDPVSVLSDFLKQCPEEWDKPKLFDTLRAQLLKESGKSKGEGASQWEILEMEFSNMFGYGPNNKISFQELPMHETIGVFGENSAGKSSLIEIMVFLLYDKITRYAHGPSVPKEIIRFGETKSSGSIQFRVRGDTYKIEKKMTRQKSGKIRVDEKLWKMDSSGTFKDWSEEHRKKTDKFVSSQIGTCQQFLFTTVFLQQNEQSFRSLSPKDRKEFLYQLLGLEKFEELCGKTNDDIRLMKKELDVLEKQIKDFSISRLREEQEKIKSIGEILLEDEMETKRQIHQLEEKKQDWFGKLKPVPDNLLVMHSKLMKEKEAIESGSRQWKDYSLDQEQQKLDVLQDEKPACPTKPVIKTLETKRRQKEWADKDAYNQWCGDNAVVVMEEIEPVGSLFREKDEWTKKMIVVSPKDPLYMRFNKISSSKKLKTMMNPNTDEEDTEEEDMDVLEETLKQLETDIEPLEKELNNKRIEIRTLDARRDQMSKTVGRFRFHASCSSCTKNKEIVSDSLRLEEERRQLKQDIENLESSLTPMYSKQRNVRDRIQTLVLREQQKEENRMIQTILYNRSIEKKIGLLEEKILQAEQNEENMKLRKEWKEYLEWNDAYTNYLQHESTIRKQKELIEQLKKQEENRRRLLEIEKEMENTVGWMRDEQWNKKVMAEINQFTKTLNELKVDMERKIEKRLEHEKKKEAIEQKLKTATENTEKYNEMVGEIRFLKQLSQVIGRDGFPLFMVEKSLPVIEGQLTEILGLFFGEKKVRLRLEKKRESANVLLCVENKSGDETVYVGGMEGFMIDAALKIVFARMSRLPRPDLFVIDEGISALDQKNMENLDQLFVFLETFFSRVFIISHIRQVQEFVRRSLRVVKENGVSCIKM